jgi:endonuclease YncB( thermonuclease family)
MRNIRTILQIAALSVSLITSSFALTGLDAIASTVAQTNTTSNYSAKSDATKLSESQLSKLKKYTVSRVVDGDTFVISSGKRIRLIGVDTPETVNPNVPEEYYGREASNYTKKMLTGKTVYLARDVSNTDRYGRLLRYVYLSNGTFYNYSLVKKGYADVTIYSPDDRYKRLFYSALDHAQENKLGMWK